MEKDVVGTGSDSKILARRFIEFTAHVKRVVRGLVNIMEGGNVTDHQFKTMMKLMHTGRIGLKELSGEMGVSASSLCIMLTRLYNQGLVSRVVDEADRRNTLYSLSQKGRDYTEAEFERKVDFLGKRMDELFVGDRKRLLACMDELDKLLKKLL